MCFVSVTPDQGIAHHPAQAGRLRVHTHNPSRASHTGWAEVLPTAYQVRRWPLRWGGGPRGRNQGQKLQSHTWAAGRNGIKASQEYLRNEALRQRPPRPPRQGFRRPSAQAPAPTSRLLLSLQTRLGCRTWRLPGKTRSTQL